MSYKGHIKKILKAVANDISARMINKGLFKINNAFLKPGLSKNIISLCLFGNGEKYFANINNCIESYQHFFPDWIIRIYLSKDLRHSLIEQLEKNVEIVIMDSQGIDYRYTFWRFMPLDDNSVDKVLVRDIDSVATYREKKMVDEWLKSGKKMHIIRDHPDHIDRIMAGMWGIRVNRISQHFLQKMMQFKKINKFGIDQQFLKIVYTQYSPDIFVNDIFKRFEDEEPSIIPHGNNYHFVGEVNINTSHSARQTKALIDFYKKYDKNS